MNRYNNEYGFHTPKLTKKLIQHINEKTNIEWLDNSWHNDLVDSLYYKNTDGETFFIMLPNGFIQDEDNELFNYFTILDEDGDELKISTNVDEIIQFIINKIK